MERSWYKFYPTGVSRDIDIACMPSLSAILERACERFSDKIALTCLGSSLTYHQLDDLAAKFAGFLQQVLGMQKGDRIAIMLPNIPQFAVAFFGAQKIGVVTVPVNPLYTPRELEHQLKDCGAITLITMNTFVHKLDGVVARTKISHIISTSIGDHLPGWKNLLLNVVFKVTGLLPSHRVKTLSYKKSLKAGTKNRHSSPQFCQDDLCILQYTGGTTGISKGAMLSQRNLLANIKQVQLWCCTELVDGQETILTALPLFHIFALTVNFLTFLTQGQRIILVPKPVPIKNTVKIFEKYPISCMTGVTTLYGALVNDKKFQNISAQVSKNLKICIQGGMALTEIVDKAWQSLIGKRIIEGYGLTEASPITHCNPVIGDNRLTSIGIPFPSTEAKIVDESGQELPDGEVGELIVSGPQVMVGYWKNAEETKKILKDGWLFTGDMSKRDKDGYFYLIDRKKDMIVVSGFNVYPNEIDAVLTNHEKVAEAAVIGLPDNRCGETIKAFIVKKDPSLTEKELINYCHKELTGYKRPRQYEFVDSLPKSNVGKYLRRALREKEMAKVRMK